MAADTEVFEAGDLVYVRSLTSQRCALGEVRWAAGRWARVLFLMDSYPWSGVAVEAGSEQTLPLWRVEAVRW